MFLKRLEIRGFKSFADHTEINLNPGVNIIVGPNGCGKSNIVDSIRWALGESNIRNLRGMSAEDIIFNGTDNKKALGLALVNLCIDNRDHVLPVDYDEVVVGRKVYRSGESEFYLNQTKVRMKDIANLFTGTGLGKKGYSIISQGELEQVLNGQAFERRLILEEASGIIKYRQQRDEVNRRIAATSSDMERAADLLAELQTRRDELSIKAQKALAYANLAEECEHLEKAVMSFEWGKLRKDVYIKKQELAEKIAACQNAELNLAELQKSLALATEELNRERLLLSNLKDTRYETNTRLNSLRSEYKLYEEKVKNAKERIESCLQDENKYRTLLENINSDLKLAVNDLEREEQSHQQRCRQVNELEIELDGMRQQGYNSSQALARMQAQIKARNREEADIRQTITLLEQELKANQEQKERVQIHIEELISKIDNIKATLTSLTTDYEQYVKEASAAKSMLHNIEKRKGELEARAQELDNEYKSINGEIMSLDNRLAIIKSHEQSYTGYSEAVRLFMQSTRRGENKLTGIIGVMGELIKVPPGLETAIETAAGRGLENIVTENGRQAQKAIEYIKRQRMGRITFLPLDMLKVQSVSQQIKDIQGVNGVIGLASQLVEYNPRYQKAVEYLLGRVLVVANLDRSLELYKQLKYSLRLVTLEGDTINASGAMSGGNSKHRGISPLQLKNEENNLKQKREEKQHQLEKNRSEQSRIGKELLDTAQSYNETYENLTRLQFQSDMLHQQIIQLSTDLAKSQDEKVQHEQSRQEAGEFIKEIETRLAAEQERYELWLKEGTSFSEEMERLKTASDLHQREYEVKKERLNSYQDQLNLKKRELDNMHKNINQLEQIKKSYAETLEQNAAMRAQLSQDITQNTERLDRVLAETKLMQERLESLQKSLETAQQKEQEHMEQIALLQQEIKHPARIIEELRSYIRNQEISIARLETELDGFEGRWQDKFACGLPTGEEALSAKEIREYKRRISLLHQEMEELGVVDPGSIKDYEEVTQRCTFLESQFNDLNNARDSLNALLEETEHLMVKEFRQFMQLASQSFNKTFKDIFGGGEAGLTIDKGSAFEAGIEINVKMPGKRSQSLNLLSGGERALTCIAFIFALLRLRPAPFCLLDEIDAALDETNLVRFSRFLRDMSREIQFIVITHRQVTIQSGENVYGVTMPEEGISAVLSINLSDAETMAG